MDVPSVSYRWKYRQNYSVGILQRVVKYLLPMSQSLTDWPSVSYRWKYKRIILSINFYREMFFFFARFVRLYNCQFIFFYRQN
jgi:hypothetical protein